MSAGNKIGFCLDSFGFGKSPRVSEEGGEEPAGNWWEAGGATGCIQALQPKGAADYAASLLDLSGNSNDAAEGTAPDWDSSNGWKFNGSDDYLDSGIAPGDGYTVIVRFTNAATNCLFGCTNSSSEGIIFYATELYVKYGDGETELDALANGVYCIAGGQCYRNGSADGDAIVYTWSGENDYNLTIGVLNDGGEDELADFGQSYIQAFAIYDNTLDAATVAAVSTAMAAL